VICTVYLGIWIRNLLIRGQKPFRIPPFSQWSKPALLYFLFMLLLTVSALFNGEFEQGFLGQPYRYQGVLFFLSCGGLVLLVSQTHTAKKYAREWMKTVAIVGTISSVIVMVQYLQIYLFHIPILSYAGRPIGTFGNPNFAAGYLALSYVFAYVVSPTRKYKIVATLVFGTAILCTASLSGIGSFLAVFLVHWLSKQWKKMFITIVLALVVSSGMYVAYSQRTPSSFDRRSVIWGKAVQATLAKPIIGWGPENFAQAFNTYIREEELHLLHIRIDKAHNEQLEVSVAGGLIGLGLYGALMILLFKHAITLYSRSQDPFLLAICVGFVVYGSFNVISISQYILYFFSIGIAGQKVTNKRPLD
jgi:O-antigen ligase